MRCEKGWDRGDSRAQIANEQNLKVVMGTYLRRIAGKGKRVKVVRGEGGGFDGEV